MALLHHVSSGSGDPPIVFVHGFSCAHSDWDAQVAHLSPRHRTVAVDLRGHGNSPGDAMDCSVERNGADVAKALALGADAVSIGTAALVAIGENDPRWAADYAALGTTAEAYDDWHEGKDPAGITTQDPELMKRVDPIAAGRRLANYLKVMTLEAQTIARACGKSHVHNLEPEDLVALTVEAAAMARVPLAGTDWIPGKHEASR